MTNNTIKHLGIVENIQGSHLSVRIVQTSACAACSAKGHCSSADSKDKIIDITDAAADSYQTGERVMVIGETSMGHDGCSIGIHNSFCTSDCFSIRLDGVDRE